MKRFGDIARETQAKFRTTLPAPARNPTDPKGQKHPHLLAQGCELENLYPGIRGPGGALEFFAERDIKWWTNARSGDRKLSVDYRGPTRNLASSQVACINFLLPLERVPGALTELLRFLDPDVQEALEIEDPEGNLSAVEFEWVGWFAPLEDGKITRGANQTSLDAFLIARTPKGRRAYLIEWKYCEEYLRFEDKNAGERGKTRRKRYQALYESEDSSFNQKVPMKDLFYDPFYQLMRMHLLADRLRQPELPPEIRVDETRVVVVCPEANADYRNAVMDRPLTKQLTRPATVEELVRATLKVPRTFSVVAPEAILGHLAKGPCAATLAPWAEYHRARYGW